MDVPGYVVGDRIGAGGFGEVFRARHAVIGREVAIKVLHAKYSENAQAVARFVAEARAVNQVSHPGIVEISDFGQLADGRHYCVMELVTGTTLRDMLRERGRLPITEALPILRGIAEAVDAAHAAGIAHRDLKPDNVFVLPDGTIKLIDFGLAKLTREDATPMTQTGDTFGTPVYMSPEQCRGRSITAATDAYSFGVIAYQVLTGEPPFTGDALALALHHLHDQPDAPSSRCRELDPSVDHAILALLAKDSADRPATLVEAIDALRSGARPRRRSRRRVVAVAAGLAIAALLVGWRLTRKDDPRPPGRQAVAVLGFENLGAADHAWVGTGLTQMLAPALRSGEALRVPSTTTVAEAKQELGIPDKDTLSFEEMERIRAAFAPDYVVVGSFRPHAGLLEIRATLLDTSREVVAEAREDVPEAELPQAVTRIGQRLRAALGAPPLDARAGAEARALWPTRSEAMRRYAIGLAATLHEDWPTALAELTQVIELEPDFALAHYWLAQAYMNESDVRENAERERAVRLSRGLPERERQRIQADHAMYGEAADPTAYRLVFERDPDDVFVGTILAMFEAEHGATTQALEHIAQLRALPQPASSDPNIDIAEAKVALSRGDIERCVMLTTRARSKALRAARPSTFLDARSLEVECLMGLGKLDEILELVDDTIARTRAGGGKRWMESHMLMWRCRILKERSQLDAAEAACRQSVSALTPRFDPRLRQNAWEALAEVLVAKNQLDAVRIATAEVVRACGEWACPDRRALARLHAALGDQVARRAALEATVEAGRAARNVRLTSFALSDLAGANWDQLDLDVAIAERRESIELVEANRASFESAWVADGYRLLGHLLGDRGRFDEAMAAQEKAVEVLKAGGEVDALRSGAAALVMAGRFEEADARALAVLARDPKRDDLRALRIDAMVARGELVVAATIAAELVGDGPDATFARAWVALHQGHPATAARRQLEKELAALRTRGNLLEVSRLELRVLRLAAKAGAPGARARLIAFAKDLRAKGLDGPAAVAERDLSRRAGRARD